MGRSESANVSIGIKILLSDLIMQINDTNTDLIISILYKGFIEDDNDEDNNIYLTIMDKDPTEIIKAIKEFETTRKGIYLLVPIKDIISTCRWGYNREGSNCASRPLDIDLSFDVEYDIKNYTRVFIITQHAS
jgi:hypothetical protein